MLITNILAAIDCTKKFRESLPDKFSMTLKFQLLNLE